MHIAEGILTGPSMAATLVVGLAATAVGVRSMTRFVAGQPLRKPLMGMLGAFIFLVSLIPFPAFTGTTSHPCGTPLAGILLGPWIATALACLSLILQAAFFAHGGFSSLGANTLNLGLLGAGSAWLVFRYGRKAGLPIWAAAGLAGLTGDIMTYVGAGGMLGAHLAYFSAEPQHSLGGYLTVIYGAYLPTQGPIALGEMLVTGYALQSIYKMRPEVLEGLGVIEQGSSKRGAMMSWLLIAFLGLGLSLNAAPSPAGAPAASTHTAQAPAKFPGMDEAVNEAIAHSSGAPARDPYINFEAMGDLWNAVLLIGGGLAGFVIGRNWHLLFGRKEEAKK